MIRVWLLLLGATATMTFALIVLVLIPSAMLETLQKPPQLRPYTTSQALGREVYISEGCMYCHTQQVRDELLTSDAARGWGRPSVPADFVFDEPHLLGTMRTGPDLLNVGQRLPDRRWHLLHLYQPRALVPWSIMPSFPYLFTVKERAMPGDEVLEVPAQWAPAEGVVVVTNRAGRLVDYLLSLNRSYPAPPPEAKP